MKLLVWNNKNGLAVKEFEAHEDKAWAMARGGDGAYIATGGADGSLKLWEDDTLLASKHREDKMQLGIEKDQQLQDAEAIGNGSEALEVGVKIGTTARVLRVASQMTMERGEKGMQIAKGVFQRTRYRGNGAIAQVYSRLEHKLENERRGEQDSKVRVNGKVFGCDVKTTGNYRFVRWIESLCNSTPKPRAENVSEHILNRYGADENGWFER